MKQSHLSLLLALLLPLSGCQSSPAPTKTAAETQPASISTPQSNATRPAASSGSQSFDYYLLTLSWSPEYCHSHPTDVQCSDHDTFVLHGMWPENNDGSYPQSCSNATGPANPSQYKDLYPDLSLLQHEWKTHGTCSGLSPDTFFTDARKAFDSIKLPPELTQLKAQTSMSPTQIIGAFTRSNPSIKASDMALSCGSNYLTSVQVCIDKNTFSPIACGAVKTCKASTVKILAP